MPSEKEIRAPLAAKRVARHPIRMAMIAAALGVAACFGAAASFSGNPAIAAEANVAP